MDQLAEFKFDRERQLALVGLLPEHGDDLQRMLKILVFGPDFQLLVAEANDGAYRGRLIERINEFAARFDLPAARLMLDNTAHPDMAAMEQTLQNLAQNHRVIHIEGGEFWFDILRWQHFNVRREAIAQSVSARLIFWLNTEPIRLFIQHAPDCWAWRTGVFSFLLESGIHHHSKSFEARLSPIDSQKMAAKSRRLAEIQNWLEQGNDIAAEIKLPLLQEMAEIYLQLGQTEIALGMLHEQALPLAASSGQTTWIPVFHLQTVEILTRMGRFAEAIEIMRSKVLPEFRTQGATSNLINAETRLATLLRYTNQAEAALQILSEQVLPLVIQSGDLRQRAITLSEIAMAQMDVGQQDEAIAIFREQALPVFQQLGDVHSIAMTHKQIAAILLSRGEVREAIRIMQTEVLPIFLRLGASLEVMHSQIELAEMLRLNGDSAQALQLLRQQVKLLLRPDEQSLEAAETHLELARCFAALGEFRNAVTEMEIRVIPVFEHFQMQQAAEQARVFLQELQQQVASST